MTKRAVGWFIWLSLHVALLLWTFISYSTAIDPELQREIVLRHGLLMILMNLPLSAVGALLIAAAIHVFGIHLDLAQDIVLTTIASAGAGYFQWKSLVPFMLRRWRQRSGDSQAGQ